MAFSRSGWGLQVMPSEPENRVRFHRIGFGDRDVDVMAAATLKRPDVEPGWAARYPCQAHAGVAFEAVRSLD
jgi:hypothetical protein